MGTARSFPYNEQAFSPLPRASDRGQGLLFSNQHLDVALRVITGEGEVNTLGAEGFKYLSQKVAMLPNSIYGAKLIESQNFTSP